MQQALLPKEIKAWLFRHTLAMHIIYLCCPKPLFWNSFNRSHFSIFTHEYRIFPQHSPTTPFPYILPPSTVANPPWVFYYYKIKVLLTGMTGKKTQCREMPQN
jgi:hypothetical protein